MTADFSKIEKEAQESDSHVACGKPLEELTPEEAEKQFKNMSDDIESIGERQRAAEERLKKIDPRKAEQMERLGMGFASAGGGGPSGKAKGRSAVSHSATQDMFTIEQVDDSRNGSSRSRVMDPDQDMESKLMSLELGGKTVGRSKYDMDMYDTVSGGRSAYNRSGKSSKLGADDDFWDTFDMDGGGSSSSALSSYRSTQSFKSSNKTRDDNQVIESIEEIGMHGPSAGLFGNNKKSNQVKEQEADHQETYRSGAGRRGRNQPSQGPSEAERRAAEMQEKFSTAKSISSDQYFGHDRGNDVSLKRSYLRTCLINSLLRSMTASRERHAFPDRTPSVRMITLAASRPDSQAPQPRRQPSREQICMTSRRACATG